MLSDLGAQGMETSWYQLSKQADVEFYCENNQLDIDAVFRPDIDTPFSPSTFNNLEMCSMAENLILIDEEQDKEISSPPPAPLHPTTPVDRPTQLPVLMRRLPLKQVLRKFPFMLLENCWNEIKYCYSLLKVKKKL